MSFKLTFLAVSAVAAIALGATPHSAHASGGVAVESSSGGGQSRVGRARREAAAAAAESAREDVLQGAREVTARAVQGCDVTDARLLGRDAEQHPYYEVACAKGPGYLIIASEPPQSSDCVLLGSQAVRERERNPEADVGTQCTLESNTDIVRVIADYARQAGVPCEVDQALAIGRTDSGLAMYEVGCNGVQGYWVEQVSDGFAASECLQIITQNSTCRFTTAAEGAASVKAMLAGSEGAACDVNQARFIGENANGRFYEAKCAAGNGLIARIKDTAVQQVYPCETAQRIGGGCTLTQVAAAPATTEQN